MGAFCCVLASRPLVTIKSPPHSGSGIASPSQDDAMQWRTNLSFSPGAGYTRDDGLDQDMSDGSHGFAMYSSRSRQGKSLESCFQQSPRWGSNSSASGGNEEKTWNVDSIARSNSSKTKCLNEGKGFDRESRAISQSFRSLLSLSESAVPWENSSKQPVSSYHRVFCNPVSDCEIPEPGHTQKDSSTNPNSSFIMSTRNQQSSSPSQSDNTSSNEMLLDVERYNETQVRSEPPGSMTHQRCGVCKKLLSQRSPWCSYKMLRCGDMPAAGVFPCHHVYHVECLDKVTPTAQTRDPSCPVCSNTIGEMEQPMVAPETLQMELRSLRRSRAAVTSQPLSSSCNDNERRQKRKKLSCCLNISFLSSPRNPT